MAKPFSITHRVQFSETDSAGIVHFSNFFRMMEEVEHAFFRSVGLSVMMEHQGRRIGWPRVAAGCEFFGPVRFEDEVTVELRVTRVGEKSLSYEATFLLASKRVALGKSTSVCCIIEDREMRGIAIPPEMRAKLAKGFTAAAGVKARGSKPSRLRRKR